MRVLLFTGQGRRRQDDGVGGHRGGGRGARQQGAGPVHRPGALARRRPRASGSARPDRGRHRPVRHAGRHPAAFEQSWREIQSYLTTVLERAGVDALQAEELTVLPGAEEVLALLEVTRQATTGPWDLVVVDCAPTGETLRLLALPEALSWYVERVFRPSAGRCSGPAAAAPVSGPAVPQDDSSTRSSGCTASAEVRAVLTAPSTSVRLVLTPGGRGGRRGSSHAHLAGAVRLPGGRAGRQPGLPPSADPFVAGWAAAQAEQLAAVRRDAASCRCSSRRTCPAERSGSRR
jgi:arsenite-transporting ATPase